MANIGDYLTIKGVKKRWAGGNYGWQLPATYARLEKEGKFRLDTQLLDKVGSYFGGRIPPQVVPEVVTNTVGNIVRNYVETPSRALYAANNFVKGTSQQLRGVAPEKQNESVRPIGSRRSSDGKLWAGQSYGYQSPESYRLLQQKGQFRAGHILAERIGNDISTTAGRVWNNAPQPVRDTVVGTVKVAKEELWDTQPQIVKDIVKGTLGAVDTGFEAVSRATNTSRYITDEGITALLTLGSGIAAKHGGKALGRIGLAIVKRVDDIPTPVTRQAAGRGIQRGIQRQVQASRGVPVGEVGAVYTSGPKAGQYKASGSVANHPHREFIEQVGERLWQKQPPGATSIVTGKGVIPELLLPDNTVLYWKNQGASKVNAAVKGGATPQFKAPEPGKTYQRIEDFLGTEAPPLSNVPTPVPAPKPAIVSPEVRKQVVETYGLDEDVADRLLAERELEYQAGMEIYRNDILTREAEIDKLLARVDLDEKTRKTLRDERGDLRRTRRVIASEPPNTSSAYMYENALLNKPSNLKEGLTVDILNAESKARDASRPISRMEAHHDGSVSSVESYIQNLSAADMRETTGLLVDDGFRIGSNPHGFTQVSKPAHTGGGAGPNWGQDFAHVGGEGRFIGNALPKGTTPQQAAEAMKPMLLEQRVLTNAAVNHPAEVAMRRFVEEVMGDVAWTLPEGQKNHAKQLKISKALGLDANVIARSFSDGFAQGKTYEQIANELRNRLKINGP